MSNDISIRKIQNNLQKRSPTQVEGTVCIYSFLSIQENKTRDEGGFALMTAKTPPKKIK